LLRRLPLILHCGKRLLKCERGLRHLFVHRLLHLLHLLALLHLLVQLKLLLHLVLLQVLLGYVVHRKRTLSVNIEHPVLILVARVQRTIQTLVI
jgi:hypothetical protein